MSQLLTATFIDVVGLDVFGQFFDINNFMTYANDLDDDVSTLLKVATGSLTHTYTHKHTHTHTQD